MRRVGAFLVLLSDLDRNVLSWHGHDVEIRGCRHLGDIALGVRIRSGVGRRLAVHPGKSQRRSAMGAKTRT